MVPWQKLRWQQVWKYKCTDTVFSIPRHARQHDVVNRKSWGARSATTSSDRNLPSDTSRIRNIGIIAHIDAGKTTTTERMLYYSGYTRRLGDVDEGSTVTDFLPAEKARGITIQAAAITFDWPPSPNVAGADPGVSNKTLSAITHHINLIDTPGHADFTFEVRRSLRVLDGAICILDGVAGVEAQTEQVWKQAGDWSIPRIVYVNKLDRNGAAFGRTVREIGVKLRGWPLVCQIPWWKDGKGEFCGIGDVINLRAILYEQGGDGRSIQSFELRELDAQQPVLAAELRRARVALVELLGDHDDELIEAFLEAKEDHLAISPQSLWDSMRRCLNGDNCTIIPVFAGSSFRNIGVQPLLDAVNNLLPSPLERLDAEVSISGKQHLLQEIVRGGGYISHPSESNKTQSSRRQTTPPTSIKGCALAFKVVNDPRKGTLVYFRVYSGLFERNDLIFNTNLQVTEKASTLLRMYASDSVPVQSISAGEIGVIAGSKHARTGDTLISWIASKATPPKSLATMQLKPIDVPPPVFFASLEPNSLREEKDMHEKLGLLLREDPSLHVSQDHDTGQTLISGMGELHLEIARDRLVGELKANARMGKIAIGYRETFTQPSVPITKVFDKDKTDTRGRAGCTVKIEPIEHQPLKSPDDEQTFVHDQGGNIIVVRISQQDLNNPDDVLSLPDHLSLRDIQQSYVNGALAALSRGPKYSYPVHGVQVLMTLQPSDHIFGSETTYSALTAAARLATVAACQDAAGHDASALMEPVMDVDVSVDESNLGAVVQDLSSTRGGHVLSLGDDVDESSARQGSEDIDVSKIYAPPDPFQSVETAGTGQEINVPKTIRAKVPLKEMVGYLKHLRSMTGGRGTFVMSVDRFVKMSGQRERMLMTEIHGGG